MPSTHRKMRRGRDNASDTNWLSAYDLYGVTGDSRAALDNLNETKDGNNITKAGAYNAMLLSQLQDQGPMDAFLAKLQSAEEDQQQDSQFLGHRKQRRNRLICTYNRALCYYSLKNVEQCSQLLLEQLREYIENESLACADDLVACRMGLLLLECILCKTIGRHAGLDAAAAELKAPPVPMIMNWLEGLAKDKDVQLKFLYPVFKSRVALAQLEDSKHVDSQIRAARKDIKTAMEVFQQKLRTEPTESIAAASGESEDSNLDNTAPPSTIVVQKLNQAALSLKAHLEQLKGNTKKALILCTEASTPMVHQEYLHTNNLAVVYETNNRRQLALYSLAKSLRASEHNLFASDGTAQYDHRLSVLHNVALIALRARRYESAYECFAKCITGDHSVFRQRTTTWLRLAESCIGIHSQMKTDDPNYSTVMGAKGEIQGIMVNNNFFFDDENVMAEELVKSLGSPEDIAQVKRNPLLRSRAALRLVLDRADELDADTLASARLSFAFVSLAFGDFAVALEAAKKTLDMETTSVLPRLHDRHVATARMYAAEAYCRLGEYSAAMSHLRGDVHDDPYFYQLASHLSGVTLETASASDQGKRCLAKTQAIVLSSACAIAAAMGDPTAKQLAHSANSMDSGRTYARRALIYTLLREGNLSSSLNMLLTLR